MTMRKGFALAFGLVLTAAASALAQAPLRLPQASPAAASGETIGVTDVEIRYHRPAVNKRKIWDGLVPYGVVWRAGANENTTISFSTAVRVEGNPVPAGTYGLFMIPEASKWTLILSRFPAGWGAYSYDPSEDLLRASISPQPLAEEQERLAYTFDEVTDGGAVASLRWEKLRVPFKIEVDLPATVRASIRDELRGGKHWSSDAWAAAARWELRNGDTKAALAHADHAISVGATFGALRTKAAVLEKMGDAKGAADLRQRAMKTANEAETIYVTVMPLLGDKKYDEAIAYLTGYERQHPDSAELRRVRALLGDAYNGKHDRARAHEAYEKAFAATHDYSERTEVQDSVNAAGAQVE
jgi:tetratricopeptide (TPR) repeat protein